MRASDRAYATLLEQIQSGALAPGAVLGEVEQAARLGVSRTPLREALGRLAADGLVAQQSPRVTVVTDVDVDDIRALFEVRRALEETAARLAAARGDSAAFAALADEFAHSTPARRTRGATRTTPSSPDSMHSSTHPSATTTSAPRCGPSAPTSSACDASHATSPNGSPPPSPSTG